MANKSELKQKLDELIRWFKENPKLPAEIHPILLKRFLKCMKNNVEDTKKLIETNYTIRNKSPHIFIDRDPKDEKTCNAIRVADMMPLPGLTLEGHRILFYRLADTDPKKIDPLEDNKLFHMMSDCRFSMLDRELRIKERKVKNEFEDEDNDEDEDVDEDEDAKNVEEIFDAESEIDEEYENLSNGEIQICDVSGISMGHMARMQFSNFRIHMTYLQEAYPVRLHAMHMINCHPIFNKLISIFKPFISDEVFNLAHFHTGGLESLYEHVPRDMLPDEYGGKAGKVADLKNRWWEIMQENREYLLDPNQWKVEQMETRRRWYWF